MTDNTTAASPVWHNRIVRTGTADPRSFKLNPLNWRIHPDSQKAATAIALAKIGWIQDVIVNLRTGAPWPEEERGVETLIDGHERVKLAIQSAQENVPVKYVDLTPDEERYALATLDAIGAMAETDADTVRKLIAATSPEMAAAIKDALKESDLRAILKGDPAAREGAEPKLDQAVELQKKWRTAIGQLWQMGTHRLLIGDCTEPNNLIRLMMGELAALCWIDPPWNVNIGGDGDPGRGRTIMNDNLGDAFGPFMEAVTASIKLNLAPGAAIYMAMGANEWANVDGILKAQGFKWMNTILWVKDSLVLSRKDYHAQYEPVWHGSLGFPAHRIEDRTQSDAWFIKRPKVSEMHPTVKPVELVERAIRNSSNTGDIVIDFCAGSGTTLVAAHQAERQARVMELDPKYAACILERFLETSGKQPALLTEA